MDPTGQQLLSLLFNPGETVCVSPNKFGYHSIPLELALGEEITLVSPHPDVLISKCPSSELLLCAINPILGFRTDYNVKAFRSFLLEIDTGDIASQLGYLDKLQVPFSVRIFSGNKSVHQVITLDEDLPDLKTYKFIAQWIFKIVTFADKNCQNPSRSVRIPGAFRDKDKKQELIAIKSRVSHKELFEWLNRYEHLRPQIKPKRKLLTGEPDYARLGPWAKAMLRKGINFDRGRNLTWHSLAYDFALAGFSLEQTIEILSSKFIPEYDFKEKEFLTAINSAFKIVGEK